nr:pirin family protein [Oceanococcus sp. HetDA_MAG_MS8]
QGCSALKLVVKPHAKDLGGFSVRRTLPNKECRMIGPWVFFDHMGPANFPAGEGINVRPHPHIGISTVTYLFEGEILHRDSLGNEQPIRPGDLNLMVCGNGIVHSERQREEIKAKPHTLHALQLWLALPQDREDIDPAFYHYPQSELPATTVNGVPLRVMMGSAYGLSSPVKTFARTLYVEAALNAGQSLELPNAAERGVYVASGEVRIGGRTIPEYSMAILSKEDGVRVEAVADARIALVGGESVGQRFIEWNFVSSSKERIEQAKRDWVAGRFDKVPGDEEEFIPLPK